MGITQFKIKYGFLKVALLVLFIGANANAQSALSSIGKQVMPGLGPSGLHLQSLGVDALSRVLTSPIVIKGLSKEQAKYFEGGSFLFSDYVEAAIKVTEEEPSWLDGHFDKDDTRAGKVGFYFRFTKKKGYHAIRGERDGQKFKKMVFVYPKMKTEVPLTIVFDDDAKSPDSAEVAKALVDTLVRIETSCNGKSSKTTMSMALFTEVVRRLPLLCPKGAFSYEASGLVKNFRSSGSK